MIEERSAWLGRFATGLIGIGCTLASSFVVPALAAEEVGPAEALQVSGELFHQTWGEQVTGGFSFGLIFTVLALPGAALLFAGKNFCLLGRTFGPAGIVAGAALAVLYWLLLSIVGAAVQGVFPVALYRYAKTRQVSAGFLPGNFFDGMAAENLVRE